MFTTLYRGRRAALNVVLTLVVFAALLVIFTGHSSGALMTTVLALMTAATFVCFLVQFEPERWPTALGVTLVVFTVFFFAWPITALLPTYLKTELHLSATTVGDVLFWSGFGTAAGAVLAGFTGVVILLVALKLPLRLQRLIRPSAVRPEDGSDIVTRATSQAV
ncbi:hypothetical protein FA951_03695 [Dermacoccus nishinomiyaensis]|uniref:hypothetical protein n=1 Tax=Dermacoccus nishinomiyaensis TaxID=1274 RepID=UPI0010AC60C3|nr:hypothetical protein [Dermacoccus nishinomiyaensis]TJZ97599.1 hypothetical protein FA951_03695 [Dermacoccus nishinomiyaensis]